MDARDLVRSVTVGGTGQGVGAWRAAWRRRRADAAELPQQRGERARTPGEAVGAQPDPGGGVVRFARSVLRVRVTVTGALFVGWDGAEPEPSYAVSGVCPQADERARLEADKGGGWRVVSERMLVTVSRRGAVEVRTPGGALLRRDHPPCWWAASPLPGTDRVGITSAAPTEGGDGGGERGEAAFAGPRWLQRSELPADVRFFGLGGRVAGPRLRQGAFRLWNTAPDPAGRRRDPLSVTMPVLVGVGDAGTLLVFHDNSWDGWVHIREGAEGRGSGHDRPARCEVRMAGGPLRYWVLAGAPSRVLHGWAALTGAPAVPPRWALGHQHARGGPVDAQHVHRVAETFEAHGLPLSALHLEGSHEPEGRVRALHRRAGAPGSDGVRLVAALAPAVPVEPGEGVFEGGRAADVFVREAGGRTAVGRTTVGGGPPGDAAFPDFTDRRVRKWWGARYAERVEQGFDGVWHTRDEPLSLCAVGDRTLPRSARHALEGRGGDHREAHNVYALAMARAGCAGLLEVWPARRPFLVSRSGWAGMQRYGGAATGGQGAGWEGLRGALSLVLGLGLCGVPYAGPDVGGALVRTPSGRLRERFSPARFSPELYVRGIQLGAYLPLFRTRSTATRVEGGSAGVPWECGVEVLGQVRAVLAGRERLVPYLVTLAQLAHRTGAPYVRPLWWQHPRDRRLRDCEDAFLLGDALLVAPVLEPGVRARTVRLPAGRWYDTATGRPHDGPATVRLAAPLERVPVLARAGCAVPVRGPGGQTELEVWPPAPGRTGGGLYIPDPGEGWGRPDGERFTVRTAGDGTVSVEREGGGGAGYRVRVRRPWGAAPPGGTAPRG